MQIRAKTGNKIAAATPGNSLSKPPEHGPFTFKKPSAGGISFLQRALGSEALQKLAASGVIQPKLEIGLLHDSNERQAGRMGDGILRMPQPAIQCSPT